MFFLILLVIFSEKSYTPSPHPPSLTEKVCYFRQDGFVDDPSAEKARQLIRRASEKPSKLSIKLTQARS